MDKNNKYTKMQVNFYDNLAINGNGPVFFKKEQNAFEDYENLFTRLENQNELVGLDFGCGIARNIEKYNDRFKRLDGTDISSGNIDKARKLLDSLGIESNLYVCSGVDVDTSPSETYDFVMSCITLQHICVYDIRYSIFKDILRVLKPGGVFTAQMGFGPKVPAKNSVDYYNNFMDATQTNGFCDTRVESPEQLEKDLLEIGYIDFEYTIGKVGPNDAHPNWIYFSVKKPI